MCVFSRLPYWDPMLMASYDAMHTYGGLVADIFHYLDGADNLTSEAVLNYEHNCNK